MSVAPTEVGSVHNANMFLAEQRVLELRQQARAAHEGRLVRGGRKGRRFRGWRRGADLE
jgi:hypothetical protein